MGNVVVTAIFTPRPDALGALGEALSAAIPAVHEEEGCLLYAAGIGSSRNSRAGSAVT